jgi:ribonuclease HI
MNDIFIRHSLGFYWVPGHAGVRGNKITDELGMCGSAPRFIGPEPALRVSRQDLMYKISRWFGIQNKGRWHNL